MCRESRPMYVWRGAGRWEYVEGAGLCRGGGMVGLEDGDELIRTRLRRIKILQCFQIHSLSQMIEILTHEVLEYRLIYIFVSACMQYSRMRLLPYKKHNSGTPSSDRFYGKSG